MVCCTCAAICISGCCLLATEARVIVQLRVVSTSCEVAV